LYPNAKLIHCLRHPLDSCLSMYRHHFTEGQDFSYSLESIAHHYQNHMALMSHWKEIFPHRIHSVSYESLVEDQLANTEQLLEFCGLAWQDNCLEFHQEKRISRTASNYQVKQALNRKGLNRWVPYTRQLKQVANILSIKIEPQG